MCSYVSYLVKKIHVVGYPTLYGFKKKQVVSRPY